MWEQLKFSTDNIQFHGYRIPYFPFLSFYFMCKAVCPHENLCTSGLQSSLGLNLCINITLFSCCNLQQSFTFGRFKYFSTVPLKSWDLFSYLNISTNRNDSLEYFEEYYCCLTTIASSKCLHTRWFLTMYVTGSEISHWFPQVVYSSGSVLSAI